MKLTLLQAEAVWVTLVNYCGADPDQQEDFVRLAQETDNLEYRFQGTLGFGGKVHIENPPRVSCYREDETPAGRKVIEHANAFLIALGKGITTDGLAEAKDVSLKKAKEGAAKVKTSLMARFKKKGTE